MNKITLEALKKSIRHWEKNAEAECFNDASIGATHCALCSLFRAQRCRSCPVATAATINCENTPYGAAGQAYFVWHRNSSIENKLTFVEAANQEVIFLKSLLTKEEENEANTEETS